MNRLTAFRMGSWRVEPQLNRLSQGDHVVRVEPKVMTLLICLAQTPGDPVKKEVMQSRIWGDTAVAEGALKHLIWETRRVLKDDARLPKYLETIPKVGYRLVAPIQWGLDETESMAGQDPKRNRLRRMWWALAGLLTVTILGVLFRMAERPAAKGHRPLQGQSVTSFHGLEIDPALSPDGRWLVFARKANQNDNFDLFLKEVAGGEARRLTQTQGAETNPRWSPNGAELIYAYRGDNTATSGMYTLRIDDGLTTKILPLEAYGNDVDWSPDGRFLAVSRDAILSEPKRIYLYDLVAKRWSPITQPKGQCLGDQSPIFSPDGKNLAFIRNWSTWSGDLFWVALESGVETRLTFDHAVIAGLNWRRDGGSIIVSSDRVPPRALWEIHLEDGVLVWLPVMTKQPHNPATSRQSDALVYQEVSCDPNLWQVEIGAGTNRQVAWDLASTKPEYCPQMAPDNQRMAFISNRSGHSEIWMAMRDQPLRQLTSLKGPYIHSLQWSPDGRRLLFDTRENNGSQIQYLDLLSGRLVSLLKDEKVRLLPSWSKDGRSFYFTARHLGRFEIWKWDAQANREVLVTQAGGWMGREDWRNGDLYFAKRVEPGLWRIQAGSREAVLLTDQLAPEDSQNWAIGKNGPLFLHTNRFGQSLVSYDIANQTPRTICRLPWVSPYPGMSVSPDGQVLYYGKVEAYESDLMLVPDIEF